MKIDKEFAKKAGLSALVVLGVVIAVQVVTAEKYQAVVKVIEDKGTVGVNPLADKLDFGDLSKGSSAIRYVSLENNGRFRIRILTLRFGGISDLIKVSKNNFVLGPGDKERLEFQLTMPPSATKDSYSGWVWVFKMPRF